MSAENDSCPGTLFRGHLQEFPGYEFILGPSVGKGAAGCQTGFRGSCPEILGNPAAVLADQSRPGLENGLSAAVIGCQIDSSRQVLFSVQTEILQKTPHGVWIRPPEAIDGLVVISHYKKIVAGSGNQQQGLVLGWTHVLKFVYQDPLKTAAPQGADVRPAAQQIPAFEDHIIEIQASPALQIVVVLPDQGGNPGLDAGKAVFVTADQKLELFHRDSFRQTELIPGGRRTCLVWKFLFHDSPKVGTDLAEVPKVAVFLILSDDPESFTGGFLQNPVKNRVKSPEKDIPGVFSFGRFQLKGHESVSHFQCRRAGESHDQNAGGVDPEAIDQVSDPFNQYKGLAAAGSGNDCAGSPAVTDCLLLGRIGRDRPGAGKTVSGRSGFRRPFCARSLM